MMWNVAMAAAAAAGLAGLRMAYPDPEFDFQLAAPQAQAAEPNNMQSGFRLASYAPEPTIDVHLSDAKVSTVLGVLEKHGISFIVADPKLMERTITLSINHQPLNNVVEAIASALGGHWDNENGIRVFREGGRTPYNVELKWNGPGTQPYYQVNPFGNGKPGQAPMQPFFGDGKSGFQFKGLPVQPAPPIQPKGLQGNESPFALTVPDGKSGDEKIYTLKSLDGNSGDQRVYTLKGLQNNGSPFALTVPDGKSGDEKVYTLKGLGGKSDPNETGEIIIGGSFALKGLDTKSNNTVRANVEIVRLGNFEKLLKSLTDKQKDLMKSQGYLKLNDLAPEQRIFVGVTAEGAPGHLQIEYSNGNDRVVIRNP